MKMKSGFFLNAAAWGLAVAVAFLVFLRIQDAADEKEKNAPGLSLCAARIVRIGNALKTYAGRHNGCFPSEPGLLLKEDLLEEQDLSCPVKQTPYIYFCSGAVSEKLSPGIPLVFDRISNHEGRMHILYADFHLDCVAVNREKYSAISAFQQKITEEERRSIKRKLKELDRFFFLK